MLGDENDKRRRRRPFRAPRPVVYGAVALVLLVGAAWKIFPVWTGQAYGTSDERLDCVIIPGGGLDAATGQPAEWVVARLDAALSHDSETDYYLVLSRGTTHKPPPTESGFPVDESFASARYLVKHGVAPSRILLESWSLDTIGNAAFARLMHADLRGWRRMLVVTSAFHKPRTAAIFDWVFALPDARGNRRRPFAHLSYEEVPEHGLDADQSAARRDKEERSLDAFRRNTVASMTDLADLHKFLFVKHDAYRALSPEEDADRSHRREGEQEGPHALARSTY